MDVEKQRNETDRMVKDLFVGSLGRPENLGKVTDFDDELIVILDDDERSIHINRASLITAREVAKYFRVSVKTVGRLVRAGGLKCVRLGTRGHRRFRICDVQAVLLGEDHRQQHVGLNDFIMNRA
jgi:excisionase family DNA binding protein